MQVWGGCSRQGPGRTRARDVGRLGVGVRGRVGLSRGQASHSQGTEESVPRVWRVRGKWKTIQRGGQPPSHVRFLRPQCKVLILFQVQWN